MPAASGWGRRPPAQREREQRQRLAAWLADEVIPFSPFWRQRLSGLDDDALGDIRRLPVTEEAEIAGAGGPGNPALLLLPTEDAFKRHAGRGDLWAAAREVGRATARGRRPEDARREVLFNRYKPVHLHEVGAGRITVAYTRSDLDRLHLAGARTAEVVGLGADDALVSAVPAGPTLAFWGVYHAALAAHATALHPVSAAGDPTDAVLRACALLDPTALALPVESAEYLLTELGEAGVRLARLRLVLTVGAPPSPAQRDEIFHLAAALDGTVRVQAVWAPPGARALWAECRPAAGDPPEATYGLHTYPDLDVVELRDPASGATVSGERASGELLYTSLGWRGTAFVRVATGAWAGGFGRDVVCPSCGRTVPRLAPQIAEGAWQVRVRHAAGGWVRVDLRRAARVLRASVLERHGILDWSLREVDGQLVFAADLDRDASPPVDLVREIGHAVGVIPDLHLGAAAASARPQLGKAGPRW